MGIGSLGGAIPSNLAKKIAEELVSNGFISGPDRRRNASLSLKKKVLW